MNYRQLGVYRSCKFAGINSQVRKGTLSLPQVEELLINALDELSRAGTWVPS